MGGRLYVIVGSSSTPTESLGGKRKDEGAGDRETGTSYDM